jgi:hypothetical protein
MQKSEPIRCRVVACREAGDDGKEWSFYLINDSYCPLESATLYSIDYDWGELGLDSGKIHVQGLAPGAHALIWRDNREVRMDLSLLARMGGRDVLLQFVFSKKCFQRKLQMVDALRKAGWQVAAEECLTSPPRRVRISLIRYWFWLIPAAVLVAWTLTMQLKSNMAAKQEAALTALKSSGKETTAQITQVWQPVRPMRSGNSLERRMSYTYKVEGRTFTFEKDLPSNQFLVWRPGTTIDVTYLPDDPATHHLGRIQSATELNQGESWYDFWLWGVGSFALFGLCFMSLLLWLLFLKWRGPFRFYRHWRLARHGIAAIARVTAVRRQHPLFSERAKYCYSLQGSQPPSITAVRKDARVVNLKVGSTFLVLYDPRKPKCHVLYESLLPFGLRVVGGLSIEPAAIAPTGQGRETEPDRPQGV